MSARTIPEAYAICAEAGCPVEYSESVTSRASGWASADSCAEDRLGTTLADHEEWLVDADEGHLRGWAEDWAGNDEEEDRA